MGVYQKAASDIVKAPALSSVYTLTADPDKIMAELQKTQRENIIKYYLIVSFLKLVYQILSEF